MEPAERSEESGFSGERACTWWHVERRGSWEGRAHQTAAIHLAHAARALLFSLDRPPPYSAVSPLCLRAFTPLTALPARVSCRRPRVLPRARAPSCASGARPGPLCESVGAIRHWASRLGERWVRSGVRKFEITDYEALIRDALRHLLSCSRFYK